MTVKRGRADQYGYRGADRAVVGLVEPVVTAAEAISTVAVDFDRVTPAVAADWAPRLRSALPAFRRILRSLEEVERAAAGPDTRRCRYCNEPIPASAGGASYCSRNCRQRAYEARKGIMR